MTRNVSRSPDSESTVDSKVRLQVTLIDEINLAARQTIAQIGGGPERAGGVQQAGRRAAATRGAGHHLAAHRPGQADRQRAAQLQRRAGERGQGGGGHPRSRRNRRPKRHPLGGPAEHRGHQGVVPGGGAATSGRWSRGRRVSETGRRPRCAGAIRPSAGDAAAAGRAGLSLAAHRAEQERRVRGAGLRRPPGYRAGPTSRRTVEKVLGESADVFGRTRHPLAGRDQHRGQQGPLPA